jgi:hypothetical protein
VVRGGVATSPSAVAPGVHGRAPDPRLENAEGEATPNDTLEAKRYFQNVEDLLGDPSLDEARLYEIGKPPVVGDGSDVARRDFMTVLGMTLLQSDWARSTRASRCRKALPYVLKPGEIVPATRCTTRRITGVRAGCGCWSSRATVGRSRSRATPSIR